MNIITAGITDPKTIGTRLEIQKFAQDKELWDLYLQGLKSLQSVPQTERLSWFQIAGIHGRPYIEYDGAGKRKSSSKSFGGYCTHSSILFPPWHRPFLALFEQTLASHMMEIANKYEGAAKAKYVSAAQRFRIPYWDWAANGVLPDIISSPKDVTVNSPKGPKTFKNPLFSYTFPDPLVFGDGLKDSNFETSSTFRQATSTFTDLNEVKATNAGKVHGTIRQRTHTLLSSPFFRSYEFFSNDQITKNVSKSTIDSLEAIHGSIHGYIGGHMDDLDYAAFDPVFWLHHANVDRIFALWQARNPGPYTIDFPAGRGNFITEKRHNETATTPLAPFWKAPGEFWTAQTATDTRTFNYTYPELEKWSTFTPEEKESRIIKEINIMYQDNAQLDAAVAASKARPKRTARVVSVRPSEETAELGAVSASLIADNQLLLAEDRSYLDWVVNIIVEKYVAKSTFYVHIFLGDFNPDPSLWSQDPNLVGTHVIFTSQIEVTGCERCQLGAAEHMRVGGTIPLTGALVQSVQEGRVPDLTPEHVAPFLRKELHWRVQRADGSVIELSEIPSLKISAVHFLVTLPDAIDKFPERGEGEEVLSVTTGRLGGAGEED
ncbi:hypothetical protein FRC19_010652 [Serendipita sp. 401]|nr:hypothetical protein FRC19_010652 [Serendipita sp. 401]